MTSTLRILFKQLPEPPARLQPLLVRPPRPLPAGPDSGEAPAPAPVRPAAPAKLGTGHLAARGARGNFNILTTSCPTIVMRQMGARRGVI